MLLYHWWYGHTSYGPITGEILQIMDSMHGHVITMNLLAMSECMCVHVCVCACVCVCLYVCIHVCVYYLCVHVGLWVYCYDVMWNNLAIPLCTQRGMECPIHQWCCAVQRRMAGQPLPKLPQQLLRPRHGMVPMDERPGEHPSLWINALWCYGRQT